MQNGEVRKEVWKVGTQSNQPRVDEAEVPDAGETRKKVVGRDKSADDCRTAVERQLVEGAEVSEHVLVHRHRPTATVRQRVGQRQLPESGQTTETAALEAFERVPRQLQTAQSGVVVEGVSVKCSDVVAGEIERFEPRQVLQ